MPRSLHRTGSKYLKARAIMFARHGHVCWICGHDGAGDADHVIPVSLDPDQPIDPDGMRPAHGAYSPCGICGRRCNSERGNRTNFTVFRPKLDW